MRLALTAVALVVAVGPGWVAPCIARAHKGAIPYDIGGGSPADRSHGAPFTFPNDAEVAGIDRDEQGQVWVNRVHEFAWRRQDVDLRGDCHRALAP